jgi:hypothetical protein
MRMQSFKHSLTSVLTLGNRRRKGIMNKYANTFWLAVGIGAGIHFGVWGLIGMFAILTPIALIMDWWRKRRHED